MAYGSERQQFLYYSSPLLLKSAIASAYGIQQRRARYGRAFKRSLAFLRSAEHWGEDQLKEYQLEQTAAFLTSVIEKTPYYRDKDAYRAYLKNQEFDALPVLSKSEVRNDLEQLYSLDLEKIPHRWGHTSGTTGKSLVFPISLLCFQTEYAFKALHYSWGGIDFVGRDKVAFCSGHPVAFHDRTTPPYWVYDWANNWLLLSSYHLSERNLTSYIKELERFKPLMIGGYPSSIYLLALAYKKYGGGKLNLRTVYTASETLFDYQREAIVDAFGCKVFNWYGNSEMCANIVECEAGELHLKMEHSLVEILGEDDEPCLPGTPGRLVCTGFSNKAFPLIRYDIGDVATPAADQIPKCGRGGILIEKINGRVEDYIFTPDGRMVGRLDHLFKDSKKVIEAQIVQHDMDEVVLRLVKDDGYDYDDERAIAAEARVRLGSSIKIRFEYVDNIPRTKNGKFRFIESTLNQKNLLSNLVNQ